MKKIDYSLYLVTNSDNKTKTQFLDIIEESIKGGVSLVQLREKTRSTLDFYNLAKDVKKLTSDYDVPLIINDRIDIALAVDADGVHIGQDDMPMTITREILGDKIIGVSASNLDESIKAEMDGADYLGIGAIYTTQTKDDAKSVSIDELKHITDKINIPIVAIGGINFSNANELLNTGIQGISVVSSIMNSKNPLESAKKLKIF